MANNDKGKSWYAQHKSAVLIFALFVIGFVLVIVGVGIEAIQGEYKRFFGKLLIELAIASFVGGIATLFLSLPDVRHQLSSVLATLFSEGKIAGLLSVTARELLNKELLQQRLGTDVAKIDDHLFDRLTDLTDECLKNVHLDGYHLEKSFGPHPKNPAFLYESAAITFRIKISHLLSHPARPVKFPYKVTYQIDVPLSTSMSDDDFLLEFRLKVGDSVFTEAKISRKENGEVSALKFEFEKEFDLTVEDTGVELRYKAARLKSDNASIWRARYPTRRFQTSVYYTNAFDYTCMWFTSVRAKTVDPLLGGTSTSIHAGITATRDDWVLPGEGIAVYWTPKQDATMPAVQTSDIRDRTKVPDSVNPVNVETGDQRGS
jgi:hypothetical protein